MKIYYYNQQDTQFMWDGWKKGVFPGHLLYGATHFSDYGIEMVMHRYYDAPSRWRLSLNTLWTMSVTICFSSLRKVAAS